MKHISEYIQTPYGNSQEIDLLAYSLSDENINEGLGSWIKGKLAKLTAAIKGAKEAVKNSSAWKEYEEQYGSASTTEEEIENIETIVADGKKASERIETAKKLQEEKPEEAAEEIKKYRSAKHAAIFSLLDMMNKQAEYQAAVEKLKKTVTAEYNVPSLKKQDLQDYCSEHPSGPIWDAETKALKGIKDNVQGTKSKENK